MGNLCSTSRSTSPRDNFASPGRTLSSAPARAENPRAQVPRGTGHGGRVLGGGGGGGRGGGGSSSGGVGGGDGGGGGGDGVDARSAAAKAAEERANAAAAGRRGTGGKLSRDLASQKQQTRTDTLEGVSREERRRREIEEGEGVRRYN